MPLNPNAQKWVEALRSGEFEQGQNALCRDNKYCCLGVACEVALRNGVELIKETIEGVEVREITYNGEWAYLPKEVQLWLGLKNDFAANKSLAALNDTNYSFKEIADVIERKSERLFV